jgi:tryptophan halogenase
MAGNRVESIVIVGGGTAGWMTAALFSKVLTRGMRIRLIESDEIATIGVGEATIPQIKHFNEVLEIDENEFIRRTQGTFKLGIEFVNWGKMGDAYIHGFGRIGQDLGTLKCYQYWLKMRKVAAIPGLEQYSINTVAPRHGKFMRSVPDMKSSPLADITNAFHFDAGLYARFLRDYAEARGVVRTEGKILDTVLRESDGYLEAVVMQSGERIGGDLFIDCSGLRGLLIEQALHTGYESWNHWLPCDRAIAVPCESDDSLLPYTRSTALEAGWQWRIPLQHRIGNGHVYASEFISDDEATSVLLGNLDGKVNANPRYIKFSAGKRRKIWNKNCVAVGLSSGFLEPLESTSIHLIQTTIFRLLRYFPSLGFRAADSDEFNRRADFEYERIRDFLILHYKATQRDDSPFWDYCRNMVIPQSLQTKIDLFRSHGRIFREWDELFGEESWLQVMLGQGIQPEDYDPLVDERPVEEVARYLSDIETVIRKCVAVMPSHKDYIAVTCAAGRA